MKLVPGLYETLITRAVEDAIGASADLVPSRTNITEEAAPHLLARYAQDALFRALRALPAEGRLEQQIALTNAVIDLLAARAGDSGVDDGERPDEAPVG